MKETLRSYRQKRCKFSGQLLMLRYLNISYHLIGLSMSTLSRTSGCLKQKQHRSVSEPSVVSRLRWFEIFETDLNGLTCGF